jgi:hypothetical protein
MVREPHTQSIAPRCDTHLHKLACLRLSTDRYASVCKRACSASFLEEFFSEEEHILIRCGESRRRAGSRRMELKDPDPLLCLEGAG